MFDKLPGHDLRIPEFRPAPIPPRPVIPWAAYASDFSKNLSQVLENLSPEERQRKKVELDILDARAREAHLSNEWNEFAMAQQKLHSKQAATTVNKWHDKVNKAFGNTPPNNQGDQFEGGPHHDHFDTSPPEHSGLVLPNGAEPLQLSPVTAPNASSALAQVDQSDATETGELPSEGEAA